MYLMIVLLLHLLVEGSFIDYTEFENVRVVERLQQTTFLPSHQNSARPLYSADFPLTQIKPLAENIKTLKWVVSLTCM